MPEGTIFEELVTQYLKLVSRAEDLIVHTITWEVEVGLKAHFAAGSTYVSLPYPSSALHTNLNMHLLHSQPHLARTRHQCRLLQTSNSRT